MSVDRPRLKRGSFLAVGSSSIGIVEMSLSGKFSPGSSNVLWRAFGFNRDLVARRTRHRDRRTISGLVRVISKLGECA
jgi:hypothetical protein